MGAAGNGELRVVMLGAPGCGKGTQAERLAAAYGIPAISTGEMLRAAVAAGSELGRKVQSVMAQGALVDDELMAEVVRERLAHGDAARGFLLDGYPRTAAQAGTLEEVIRDAGKSLDHVLYLDVPEDVLVERALGRGRADDTAAVVRERLRVYRDSTEPLVEHYRHRGLLRTVRGDQSVDAVAAELQRVIDGKGSGQAETVR
ncbi:MAG TPA: adenylate kinase [Thermoanaerobaculia bacterium]|nr:adenylate kinase [Thermoanaerobaculia bacterium]